MPDATTNATLNSVNPSWTVALAGVVGYSVATIRNIERIMPDYDAGPALAERVADGVGDGVFQLQAHRAAGRLLLEVGVFGVLDELE